VDWGFVGIMVGSTAYLALIVLAFVQNYRENKAKIEQTRSDVDRVEEQIRESEHARKEAEDRATKLEEEALGYEQQITELQAKIRVSLPDSES
tara:strand:- start:5332 stop:5610 length:279 start_codon:yes stop_codon:yes gene_type:complete